MFKSKYGPKFGDMVRRAVAAGKPVEAPSEAPKALSSPLSAPDVDLKVNTGPVAMQVLANHNDIPPDWEDLLWPQLRKLASSLSSTPIKNRAEAERAIRAAL